MGTIAETLFKSFRQSIGRTFRSGFIGLAIGVALVEGLATFLNQGVSNSTNLLTWPPTFDLSHFTFFVHTIAVLFGLVLGSLMAVVTATVQTLRGVFNAADAAVDAVDGPNRHGLF